MLHQKENETKDQVTELIMMRERKVMRAIKRKRYKVKHIQSNNISQIRSELNDKLSEMRDGIHSLSQMKELSKIKG